jgi:hypothetical protein
MDIHLENYIELVDKFIKTVPKEKQLHIEFREFIFSLVKEFYQSTIIASNKPKKDEWTVYSSVILQNKDSFKIIVFTNGTKSLPNKNYGNRDCLIHDCHAEILALRCLKMFLMRCLIYNLIELKINNLNTDDKFDYLNDLFFTKFMSMSEYESFKTNKEFFDIFYFSSESKIMLKENIHFHLYISESPCGDASIYPCLDNDLNQTGSKTIDEVLKYLKKENTKITHDNSISKVRSKSMRSDISHDSISYSLSCSDKLLIKNVLGLQGVYLSHIIERINLSSILISIKHNTESCESITASLIRGLSILRRKSIYGSLLCSRKDKMMVNEPMINITTKNLDESNLCRNDKNALSFSSYWYYGKSNITKLDPITGLKLGTSLKNLNYEKSGVEINDYNMFMSFLNILDLHSLIAKNIINNKKLNFLVKKVNFIIKNLSNEDLKKNLMMKLQNRKYIDKKKLLNKILEIEDFIKFKQN